MARTGRRKGWRWQFFNSRRETRDGQPVVVASCKFCDKEYFGRERCKTTTMDEHLLKKCKQIPPGERKKLVQYRDEEDDSIYLNPQKTIEEGAHQSAEKRDAGVARYVGNRTKNLYVWTYFVRFATSKVCLICGTRLAGSYPNNTATMHLEGRHGVSGDKHNAESEKILERLMKEGIDLRARRREATEAEEKRLKSIAAGIECDELSLPWNSWNKKQRTAPAPKHRRSLLKEPSLARAECEGRNFRRGHPMKSVAGRESESSGIRPWLTDASVKRKRERSPEVDEASMTKEEKIAKLERGIREDKERLKILRAELSQLELEEARLNSRSLQSPFAAVSANNADDKENCKNARGERAEGDEHEKELFKRNIRPTVADVFTDF